MNVDFEVVLDALGTLLSFGLWWGNLCEYMQNIPVCCEAPGFREHSHKMQVISVTVDNVKEINRIHACSINKDQNTSTQCLRT